MTRQRVLITGGTGLLGKTLLETAPPGWDVIGAWHATPPPVDWRSRLLPMELADAPAVLATIVALEPAVVIHAGAIGSVDAAERDPVTARRVNVQGAHAVAAACHRLRARLIHISSNAVFDGLSPPYAESSPVRALNAYGRLKIEAERVVKASGARWTIVRPILLYGWPWPGGRENVVTRWLARLESNQPVEAARDVVSMPLAATNAAEAVWAAVHRGTDGVVHCAGADRLTLAEFALEVARAFGADARLIRAVASDELGLAPRPRDTSFITTRMQQALGVRPVGVEEGLAAMARERVAA